MISSKARKKSGQLTFKIEQAKIFRNVQLTKVTGAKVR